MMAAPDPFEQIAKWGDCLEDNLYVERELTVLKDETLLGKIAVAHDGRAMALEVSGKSLGIFRSVKEAVAAFIHSRPAGPQTVAGQTRSTS